MSGSGEGGGAGVTFPLSEHQLVMWLDERLHPGTTPNNISQALRPHEWLDPPVLRAALHRLIERHPQLRITVHEVDGVPVQTVGPVPAADDPAGHPVLAEVDARGWSDDDVASWFADESFRPFDLTVGPPIRFTLLRRSAAEQVFVGVIHHIVADLWSLAILAQEVAALYRHEQGRGEEPPGPRSTYRDFVDRQRALLSSGAGDELRDFWAGLLADPPDPLALPSERAGPSSSGRAASVSLQLDRATTARLRHLAAESGTTMFAVTLAGFAALLHRTTERDDLLIATNRANRTARSARVVGCYTNVLLLRSRMADDPSFAELVASTAGVVRDAFQHGAYPYRGALGLLRAGGRGAEAAGAQVAFSWQKTTRRISTALSASMATNTPMSGELADGFGVDVAGDSRRSTGFELSVVAAEVDDRVTFAFEFQVERFDSATIQRMASQLGRLLAAAASAPSTRVGDLAYVGDDELHEIERSWLASAHRFDRTATFVSLFEAQVARTPAHVAVTCNGASLTYEQLDRRANQVAREVLARVPGPGSLVGIALPRSLDMVVAVVAVLKAGCSYLAFDPEFPPERLRFMREDCSVACVVTDAHLASTTVDGTAPVLLVDRDAPSIGARSDQPLDLQVAPTSLAYLSYTSGSTGRPKAVEIEHGAVVNLLTSMVRRLGLDDTDVMLAVTTLSFDMSVTELLLPLVVGARVVVADAATAGDPVALRDLIDNSRPTVMQATVTMWRLLIDAGWSDAPGLTVVCGAEPMSRRFADQLLARAGAVWNIYGPTEVTVWASLGEVREMGATITIGAPIDNAVLYVLDARQRPVPVGVQGELCVGGIGVARGYRNRPAATAAAFVADPFSSEPGARMYRTGDQARLLADGRIELLGRIDHQVKIRGRRIELGEIEAVLERHPAVRQAVVDVKLSARGDQRLVAYLTGTDVEHHLDELRAACGAALPDYMIPGNLVPVDAIPLTPTKKVDRAALPWPVLSAGSRDDPGERPRPGLERLLAGMWEDLLDIAGIGRNDDFFELGGHSLLAIELVGRLERTGHTMPVTAVVEAPTVAELAELITAGRDRPYPRWTSLVPIQTAGTQPPLFLVAPWGGTSLSFTFLGRELQDDQPLYGLQPQGLDRDVELHATVEEMASHYIAEMRDVQPHGPYAIGGHCSGGMAALEMTRQLRDAGEEVEALLLVDWRPPAVVGSTLGLPGRVAGRAQYYWRNRRFVFALRHQLSRSMGVARRTMFGTAEQRRLCALRRHMFKAHNAYHERPIPGDAVLIHTRETDELGGREWHDRWAGLVDGQLSEAVVPGTHATVLFPPLVSELATTIKEALSRSRSRSTSDEGHTASAEPCVATRPAGQRSPDRPPVQLPADPADPPVDPPVDSPVDSPPWAVVAPRRLD